MPTRWQPVCDWLADEFPMALRSHGVGVPWSPDTARHNRTDGSGAWGSLTSRAFGWDTEAFGWPRWLGATGHAFSAGPAASVNALAAPEVWSTSREQLEAWLAKGLLLDGPAAIAMIERGLGDLIGFSAGAMDDVRSAPGRVECVLDPAFGLEPPASVGMPAKAISVHADGTRTTAVIEENAVRLPRALQMWEFVVLVWP